MAVFHAVLSSGSCGNCYVFYDGDTAILIDQGFSLVELRRRLTKVKVPVSNLQAVFLTHFHPDHSKGLGVIARKLQLPLYINEDAIDGESQVFAKLNLPPQCVRPISTGEITSVGNFNVTAFKTNHDSKGSVGYFIENDDTRITLITDTGIVNETMMEFAQDSDYLFLEANYDKRMLLNGPYPKFLKNRVDGNWGHLSNDQAINFIKDSGFHGKGVYFIHLSTTNNTVEIVDEIAEDELSGMKYITCPRGELIVTSEETNE
jgi:phosphoribosyl 1,2-cyclic phosphodiesterase